MFDIYNKNPFIDVKKFNQFQIFKVPKVCKSRKGVLKFQKWQIQNFH